MKRYFFWTLLAFAFLLQSCSLSNETVYHRDGKTSTTLQIDMSQMMEMTRLLQTDSVAAAQSNSPIDRFSQFPTRWTSVYDLKTKEGFSFPQDSLEIYKRIMIKSERKNSMETGFSIRMDRMDPNEMKDFFKVINSVEGNDLHYLLPKSEQFGWDGKKVKIGMNFASLGLENLRKQIIESYQKSEKLTRHRISAKKAAQLTDQTLASLQMMGFQYVQRLRFESPIKSITGHHDYVKKLDDRTVEIRYNTSDLLQAKSSLVNKDPQIIIETE